MGGEALVQAYGPTGIEGRGGTVAFNLLRTGGDVIPYSDVEQRAAVHGVALRGGCFCNPGAAEKAFGLGGTDAGRCLDQLEGRFNVPAFAACINGAVGALRLSVGPPSTFGDLDRALALIASYAD